MRELIDQYFFLDIALRKKKFKSNYSVLSFPFKQTYKPDAMHFSYVDLGASKGLSNNHKTGAKIPHVPFSLATFLFRPHSVIYLSLFEIRVRKFSYVTFS